MKTNFGPNSGQTTDFHVNIYFEIPFSSLDVALVATQVILRIYQNFHRQPTLNHSGCDIGMGLEWSGNETHQEVRVVKVEELVHKVEDAQP